MSLSAVPLAFTYMNSPSAGLDGGVAAAALHEGEVGADFPRDADEIGEGAIHISDIPPEARVHGPRSTARRERGA